MHTPLHVPLRTALFAFALFAAAFSPSIATTQPADVVSVVGDATHWTGMKWTADDAARFGGMPVYHGTHKDLILIRYLRVIGSRSAETLFSRTTSVLAGW